MLVGMDVDKYFLLKDYFLMVDTAHESSIRAVY